MWCRQPEVHWHEEAAAAGFLLGVGTGLFVSRFLTPVLPKAKHKPLSGYAVESERFYQRPTAYNAVESERSYDPEDLHFVDSASLAALQDEASFDPEDVSPLQSPHNEARIPHSRRSSPSGSDVGIAL